MRHLIYPAGYDLFCGDLSNAAPSLRMTLQTNGSHEPDSHFRYLTLKQAAPLTGMGIRWLWDRLGKRGGPPYFKRGRRILFQQDEFEEWCRQRIIK